MHFIDFYALVTGVTSIHVDFARKKVLRSRLLSIYAMCINVGFVAFIPYLLQYDLDLKENFPEDGTEASLSFLTLTNYACIALLLAVVLSMVIFRLRHERLYEAIALEFFAVDRAYFDKEPPQKPTERRFNLLLLAKTVLIFGHIGSSAMSSVLSTFDTRVMIYIFLGYFLHVYFMGHSRMFQFYASLAQAYKRFQLLNAQLGKLLDALRGLHVYAVCVVLVDDSAIQDQRQSAVTKLQQISRAHWRLTCLVQRICNTFFIQATAMLLTNSIESIAIGYIAAVIIDGTMKTRSTITNFVHILTLLMLISDMFCLYRLCDATSHAHQRCGEILREFQTLPLMDVVFERCCESFSFQLLKRRLNISMGGMFSLNRTTLLALYSFILSHIIFMIQFDYGLRLEKLCEFLNKQKQ